MCSSSRRLAVGLLLFLVPSLTFSGSTADADRWFALQAGSPETAARVDAIEKIDDGVRLRLVVPGLLTGVRPTRDGARGYLDIPGAARTARAGEPALPVLRYLVEVPPGARTIVEFDAPVTRTYTLRDLGLESGLMPVQLPVPKIEGAEATIPFVEDAAIYGADRMVPAERAVVVDRAVIRGRHVALVEVRPVRYNPVRQTVELFERGELTVHFAGGEPVAARRNKGRLASITFDAWLDREIVSLPGTEANRASAGGAGEGAVGMVVVVHDSFADAVQPLVDWKRKTGFKVEVLRTSDLGSPATDVDVKAAIQARYDSWSDPALDFVLMVGDTDFTPIHQGSGGGNSQVTDNWYGCLDGSDYLPEIAVARISTRSAAETTNVVDKLLSYQQATFATEEWIKKVGFIGTNDSGYITMIEDTHDDCIGTYYTPGGYQPTDWSHGGSSCDRHYNTVGATTAEISDSIDDGRSIVNYSGHGWSGGWEGPTGSGSYDSGDVRGNSNAGMYPFVISNACVTGQLEVAECYAEVWQKEPDKGAIGFWGASNNSYWGEDDVLQRSLHDNLFPMDATPPLGVIINDTKLDLYNHYGPTGAVAYYYDMYNLLADPSLSLWTRAPRTLEVSYPSATPIGQSTFDVAVSYLGQPVAGALVALRKTDETVFEAGVTDAAGIVNFSLDPAPLNVGSLEVTVTGHDWRPHEGTVQVIAPDSPWLIHVAHGIDDIAGGDGDGTANPGETIVVPVTVENVGGMSGEGLQATLTTTTPGWCQVLDAEASFPDLLPQTAGQSLPDHFTIAVDPAATDGGVLGFDLAWSATDGSSATTSFQEPVRAVDFTLDGYVVDDSSGGNGNGTAGPGETAELTITVANSGHHGASGITGTLTSSSPYVTLLQASAAYPALAPGQSGVSAPGYRFAVALDAPDQQPVNFELTLTDGAGGYTELLSFDVPVSSCTTYASLDVPLQIDDGATAYSELAYLEALTVTEANVFVDVTHSYIGDLRVVLESPLGTQVVLHDRTGGSGGGLTTWYDEQTTPVDSMTLVDGENSFGSWKLIVEDHALGNIGALDGWSVELCGPAIAPVAMLASDGFAVDDAGTCNPDFVADVGETVVYNVTVKNAAWAPTSGVSAALASTDPVLVLNSPLDLPDLAVGERTVAPFEVLIGALECLSPIQFTLDLSANEGAWSDSLFDTAEGDVYDTTEAEDVELGGSEPGGWSHVADRGTDDWRVVSTKNHTPGGGWSWFASDVISMKDDSLFSPPFDLAGTSTLEFWHWVTLETDKDGGVLEISVDGGAWTDLGPWIVQGGYNGVMTGNSLIAGRSAWTGNYLSWRRSVVDLSAWAGSSVQLRFRLTCNLLGAATGWWVDDVVVSTHDEVCDANACGIPGEVHALRVNLDGGEALLEWPGDPLCVEFGVWRSTDPTSAGAFVDVTFEDPDPTDLSFRDGTPGDLVFWIVEGRGPDGDGPWGHFGQ